MGWLLAFLGYVALLVFVARWFYCLGVASGRLLAQRDVLEAEPEPERHLYVVRGERWHDDGPGAA